MDNIKAKGSIKLKKWNDPKKATKNGSGKTCDYLDISVKPTQEK